MQLTGGHETDASGTQLLSRLVSAVWVLLDLQCVGLGLALGVEHVQREQILSQLIGGQVAVQLVRIEVAHKVLALG